MYGQVVVVFVGLEQRNHLNRDDKRKWRVVAYHCYSPLQNPGAYAVGPLGCDRGREEQPRLLHKVSHEI